mgnify:CR=1 FL=1
MRRRIIQRFGNRGERPKRYSVSSVAYTISANPMSDTNQQVIVLYGLENSNRKQTG